MPCIMVTGVTGLLGSNLSLELAPRSDVVGVSHSRPFRLAGVRTATCDLSEPDQAAGLVEAFRPDAIIHCAALADVDMCERDRALARAVNVDASMYLARAAATYGVRFVHISTDSVFDGEKGSYVESDLPNPLNYYAQTKLEAENEVLSACPEATVVRTSIFGWNALDKSSLAEWVLGRLESGDVVPGFRDVFFGPILVNDLAAGLELLVTSRTASGLLHVAGAERLSKADFARRIARAFALDEDLVREVSVDEASLAARRPKDTSLDCSEARLLGIQTPGVSEGLTRLADLRSSGYLERLKATTR